MIHTWFSSPSTTTTPPPHTHTHTLTLLQLLIFIPSQLYYHFAISSSRHLAIPTSPNPNMINIKGSSTGNIARTNMVGIPLLDQWRRGCYGMLSDKQLRYFFLNLSSQCYDNDGMHLPEINTEINRIETTLALLTMDFFFFFPQPSCSLMPFRIFG